MAVCLQRTPALVVALLGILFAGGDGVGFVGLGGRYFLYIVYDYIVIYVCSLLSLFFFLFDTRRLDGFRLAGGSLSILVSPINFLSAIHHPTISGIVYSVLHPTYCKFYLNGRQHNFSKSGFVHVWAGFISTSYKL